MPAFLGYTHILSYTCGQAQGILSYTCRQAQGILSYTCRQAHGHTHSCIVCWLVLVCVLSVLLALGSRFSEITSSLAFRT